MTKKKKQRQSSASRSTPRRFTPNNEAMARRFDADMAQVTELTDKKRWQEALELLTKLNRRYPNHPDLLNELANVYYELDDIASYQKILLQIAEFEPDEPDVYYNLAGSYLLTMRPVLAYQAYRRCVERWPDYERADLARETLSKLETQIPKMLGEMGLTNDADGIALAAQHEELQVALNQGDFRQVEQIAQGLLKARPHLAAAQNNLSLAYWMGGDNGAAIETAQQVLTYAPENVHALSNLIHFLCAQGRVDEARAYADPLRNSTAPAADKRLKQMEGFTFLEDYPTVLALFEQARTEGHLDYPRIDPLYFHLAAVATFHGGDKEGARRLWQQALKQQWGYNPAQDNLADLSRPVEDRNGVWAFPFGSWVSQQVKRDIEIALRPASTRGNERMAKNALRHYLQQRTELYPVFSILLKRGDPTGREFVLSLARLAEMPEMSALLREFVFSPHGPDKLRMEIMNWLGEHGEMPSGTQRMYIRGEWRDDMLFLGFAVGDESEDREPLPANVRKLAEQATLALQAGDWRKAQPLLERALALYPDSTTLLNNMATVYEMQGRTEEAHAMVRDIHARFPNYLFARVSLARMAMHDGDLTRAHDLLDPLLQRRKLHFSEFGQMMSAFIDLYIAEGNKEAAKQWLEMWEQADPQNPRIAQYKLRLGISDFRNFFGLGRRRR